MPSLSKFSTATRATVKQLAAEGRTVREIAELTDVSPATAARIAAASVYDCEGCGARLRTPARLCGFCEIERG